MKRLAQQLKRKASTFSLAVLSVNILLGSAASLQAFAPVANAISPITTIVVKPSAMANWTISPSDSSVHGTFVAGPAVAPAGEGSLQETTGADGDQYVIAHTTDFSGTPLSNITSFSYRTYVHDNQDSQAPYVSLRIDNNNDGVEDDRLYFEPVYQNGTYTMLNGAPAVPNQCGGNPSCVTLDTWQTWNLQTGGWWSLNDSAGGPPLYTLASYVAAHPSARIINGATGGIRIVAGGGAPSWNNFDGNVDMLTIGVSGNTTTYDFEPDIPPCSSTSFDSFTNGSVNGQDGWTETNATYDQAIVPNTYGYSTFGCKSLRVSDAVTSGGFDWIFMKPLTNSVGESAATAGSFSAGTKLSHYEVQFDVASTLSTYQPGLHVSVSPDRGDGSRMSYLRFEDQADGIHVFFDDYNTTSQFVETDIATISRTAPHTVKLTFDAVEGASNDIVKVYIDGVLEHTGTSWEDYYRFDPEASAEQSPRIVKTMIIQARGTATPANSGKGLLFDNFNLAAGQTTSTVQIAKYVNGVHATTMNTSGATFNMTAVYNASNIGSGSDPYTISATGNGTPTAYEASTIPLAYGVSYSTYENTTAPCTAGYPFDLVGYTTDDTMTGAEAGIPSLTVPAFTNLATNKYVIVWNKTCPPAPVHVSPADGSTVTTAALDKIDWTDVTADPSMPISYFYQAATTDTSTNPDGSFVNPVYTSIALSSSEIPTTGTPAGTYHWHVRAMDAAGNSSPWTTPWTVIVDNTPVPPADVCGDGAVTGAEQCDDGNAVSGDGCSNVCMVESGYSCSGSPTSVCTPNTPVITFSGIRNQSSGTYDNTQPIQACGMTNASGYIAFEWQDVGSDPSVSYEYKILSGPAAVGFTTTLTTTHANGSIPSPGTYVVQVTPKDALGHTGTPVTCGVTYDPTYVAPVACTLTDPRLAGYWKLDEAANATIAEDSTSNHNDGTVSGAMSAATGATTTFLNAGAYHFDGVNDSIDLGTNVGNFTLADSFTVSAWINPALDSKDHAIYGNTWSNAGYLLRVTSANKLRFILVENGSIYNGMDSAVLTPGWHHVVGTWNGTSVKVYVDGVDASATPITNGTVTTITTSAHTYIGQTGETGFNQYFNGSIDDVRVYSDALSASEVAALGAGQCEGGTPTPHSSSAASSSASSVSSEASSASSMVSSASSSSSSAIVACTTTGLTGYWPMNEATGSTAMDMTGLGHNGTLQNGTLWTTGDPVLSPNPSALAFDGTDDIVNVTNSNDYNYGSQDFTVSTFVKTTAGNRSVLGNFSASHKGWGLYIYNTNQVNFFGYGTMGNNDTAKPATVLDGNWHHIVGVYHHSGNNLTIDTYVDGVLVGSSTATTGDISANSTLYFGQYMPQPSLNGSLDDIRIYNRALTADEIANLASGCSNPVIASSASSSNSSVSSAPSEGASSSASSVFESFQPTGISTPTDDGTSGSFRGSRTNILAGVISFLEGKIFGKGGTPPGGFGGGTETPYTTQEKDMICSMKRALPTDASSAILNWVASMLSQQINHSPAQILTSLKDSSFCNYQATAQTKVASAVGVLPFPVSAAGYPISDNPTWNACITGKVTLQDIRNNPDKDRHGRGLSCATYHTGDMWTQPDLHIFFTWNSKTKQITLPTGYAVAKEPVTM